MRPECGGTMRWLDGVEVHMTSFYVLRKKIEKKLANAGLPVKLSINQRVCDCV